MKITKDFPKAVLYVIAIMTGKTGGINIAHHSHVLDRDGHFLVA